MHTSNSTSRRWMLAALVLMAALSALVWFRSHAGNHAAIAPAADQATASSSSSVADQAPSAASTVPGTARNGAEHTVTGKESAVPIDSNLAASQPAASPAADTSQTAKATTPADAVAYESGHFPGVSVRHIPGPPEPPYDPNRPRTIPEPQEVKLPDGRTMTGYKLDETWRVPVYAPAKP